MIAVLGSINVDLVTNVEQLPGSGETVQGNSLRRYPGGKGANQAVAVARMGVQVMLFGKVGDDVFGNELVASLDAAGVSTARIERESKEPTGCAVITVNARGENTIVYVPGANGRVDNHYVEKVFEWITAADFLLMQLEIPLSTVAYMLDRLPKSHPCVILDPAPAKDIRSLRLERIDFITPNRCELTRLTGNHNLERGARQLLGLGVKHVICKDGERGAHLFSRRKAKHFAPFEVTPVDSTAAGDAFNGAMAAALANGLPLEQALRWANAAGALATTRHGGQVSLPILEEVRSLAESGIG